MNSNWYCKPGFGEIGKKLGQDILNVDFELCKRKCEEYLDILNIWNICHGIDYSKALQKCRMFGANTPRDPIPHEIPRDNQYCDLDAKDRQSIDFVKLIFRNIFFRLL